MQQELTGGWPRASQGLDVMGMDPLGQGHDSQLVDKQCCWSSQLTHLSAVP